MSTPRIVFAGTPEFALASLTALLQAGHNVVAAYTQPDRPAGRGRRLTASPVKRFCEQREIAVLQPESFRNTEAAVELQALRPDLMIVAAYGLLLPQQVLDIPTCKCLNVHASVLPRWRGAAPIQAAILAGDEATGVSLMAMTAGLDCGPVFSTSTAVIEENESAGELHDRLAVLGGELLVSDLPKIISGDLVAASQDEALATYAAKIQKKDAELDWSLSADELQRHVRAYNPAPGSFFIAGNGMRVKVWQAAVAGDIDAQPGSVVQYDEDGIVLACGSGGLKLKLLQMPGKRRVCAQEFIRQIDLR